MKCDFVVGEKVVCLNDRWDYFPEENLPVMGNVYTISEIVESPSDELYGYKIFLRFEEILNQPHPDRCYTVCGFWYGYFERLESRKTNIDVFKAMLNKTPDENKRELLESSLKEIEKELNNA